MIEVPKLIFARWLANLRDGRARARINAEFVDFRSAIPATRNRSEVSVVTSEHKTTISRWRSNLRAPLGERA